MIVYLQVAFIAVLYSNCISFCQGVSTECHDYYAGACYKAVADTVSWETARQKCIDDWNGQLAVPTHPEEHDHMLAISLRDITSPNIWIGLSRAANTHEVLTVEGKTQTFFRWNSGEPNGYPSAMCVEFRPTDGLLNDHYCSTLRNYMCKYYPSKGQCRDVMHGSGTCYIPQNTWATWDEGQQHCADRYGGDLAYIGDQATQSHVNTIVNRDLAALRSYSGKSFAWIGELFPLNTAVLHKADGTVAGTFTQWNSGEPNGAAAGRNCVQMKIIEDGSWNDHVCTEINSFVCEYIPDVDECIEETDNCDQNCHNEPGIGAYSCSCNPGYQLSTDGHQCLEVVYHGCFIDASDRALPTGSTSSSSMTQEMCMEHCQHSEVKCPTAWVESDNFCYFVPSESKTYVDAKAFCSDRSSQLSSVLTETELNFVTQKALDAGGNLWIGLDDIDVEGTFKWVDGNTFISVPWASGNPDKSGGEDCVAVQTSGQIHDYPCGVLSRFICKMPKEDHRYIGCYIDSGTRAFPTDLAHSNPILTLSNCFSHCRSNGKRYAAIQDGNYCTCGDDGVQYDMYGSASSECNKPCAGNSLQTCGGTWRNQVYDLWGPRVAGVQYRSQCFCGAVGTDYSRHGIASESECSMNCAGDAGQKCGAGYRSNVFELRPTCDPACVNGVCINPPDQCMCSPGYEGTSCEIDIDECSANTHDCQGYCINTPASYSCSCQEKYILGADGKSCSRCASYQTRNAFEYQFLDARIPSDVSKIRFKLKTRNGPRIALTSATTTSSNAYAIVIGGSENSVSSIASCVSCSRDTEVSTPGILNENEHIEFYISFGNGLIKVGLLGQLPFMSHQYMSPHPINYIAYSSGHASLGDWIFCSFVNSDTYTTEGTLPDQRHLDAFQSITAESLTRCASYCKAHDGCSGFSFSERTEDCELVGGESAHDSSRLVSNMDFRYYKLRTWDLDN